MLHSVLQCVAVCCSVLQCVAACCSACHTTEPLCSVDKPLTSAAYGLATLSRIDKIICLFCRILSLLQSSFAKETCNFIDPTNQSYPIVQSSTLHVWTLLPLVHNSLPCAFSLLYIWRQWSIDDLRTSAARCNRKLSLYICWHCCHFSSSCRARFVNLIIVDTAATPRVADVSMNNWAARCNRRLYSRCELQCVIVCCSVLQCVAVCCSALQCCKCVAVLQCCSVAVLQCCSVTVLQACCSVAVLQCIALQSTKQLFEEKLHVCLSELGKRVIGAPDCAFKDKALLLLRYVPYVNHAQYVQKRIQGGVES